MTKALFAGTTTAEWKTKAA